MVEQKRQTLRFCAELLEEFREYLYERENAKSTVEKYLTDMRTFQRFLGEDAQIDKRRCMAYKEWLLKHYAVSSVNSMLVSLNQFLEFAGCGAIRVKRVREQKQLFAVREKYLNLKEYQLLLQTAQKEKKKQLAMIIETIASTGIRISELEGFTLERVKKGRVELFNKGKYRVILIPRLLRKKLLKYAKEEEIREGILFRTRSGRSKDRSNIWKEMKKLGEKTSISPEKIFPHNLRHFFAVQFYQMTKNLIHLADLLGHSSMEVTRIYARSSEEDCQLSIDRLNQKYEAGKISTT